MFVVLSKKRADNYAEYYDNRKFFAYTQYVKPCQNFKYDRIKSKKVKFGRKRGNLGGERSGRRYDQLCALL